MGNIKKGNLVIKSNPLILSKYNLSVREQKLVLSVISQIEEGDTNLKKYKIRVDDFARLLDIEASNVYTEFKEVSKQILAKPIYITKEDGGYIIINWFASAEYLKGEGILEIELSDKLLPYLIDLKKNFTRYYLENVLKLNKKYAIRLYEFFKMYQFKKVFIIEVEELYTIFNELNYKRWADFKRNVLEPIIKEINQKTDLMIFYDQIKEGKNIKKINFIIYDKAQLELELYSKKENYNKS